MGDVVVIDLVVGDHDEQRNAHMRGSPEGVAAHGEVAVANHRHREPAGALDRQRSANRIRRTGANAATAVIADIVERMLEVHRVGRPAERIASHGDIATIAEFAHDEGEVAQAHHAFRARRRERRGVAHWPLRLRLVAGTAQTADGGNERPDDLVGRRQDLQVHRRQSEVIHAPAVVQVVVHRAVNDLGFDLRVLAQGLDEMTLQVHPVQRQDNVGILGHLGRCRRGTEARLERMQRMIRREGGRQLCIGQHGGAERLGEFDARIPVLGLARAAAEQDQRLLRIDQKLRRLLDGFGGRRRRFAGLEALHVREADLARQLRFLQADVEAHIGRPIGLRRGNLPAAHERLDGGTSRARLIVPFGIVADDGGLILRRVDPVDPGAALFGIAGARGAQDQHRVARAPGVEDGHGCVHQADVGMQCDGHRLFGDLGIALRDADGMFFMQADHHLRVAIAEIVDEAVVQAAVAGARRQRDIFHVETAQRLGHGIGSPAEFCIRGLEQLVLVVEARGCEGHITRTGFSARSCHATLPFGARPARSSVLYTGPEKR